MCVLPRGEESRCSNECKVKKKRRRDACLYLLQLSILKQVCSGGAQSLEDNSNLTNIVLCDETNSIVLIIRNE